MKRWSSFAPRDRRALALGALVLGPALVFSLGVKPYLGARATLVERLRVQRDLLGRELGLVASARDVARTLAEAGATLSRARPRLFQARDPLGATAALVSYAGDGARRQGVLVEAIESRPPEPTGNGLIAARVEMRGRGDLEGLLRWLHAIESGPKLVRVEQLSVARLEAGAPSDSVDSETLSFAATLSGYLLSGAQP